ncbi:TATA-binding protein-associated factor 172 [Zerene cesonia]|uniref:TATA-binding protein-associated factor 172 n=1 Tax=Zerene cesonia TaxID=33412 RepID=UPI0018E4EDAC|nr:TATA-binding protein-associated factor 172 [Zerene cesonia]
MTSRLDRLFVLLEAGSGPATRRAAARQLGEVQKAHPEELHRLLARLMKHLRSPAWETRIAATQAVEAILSNVPEWCPSFTGTEVKEEEDAKEKQDSDLLKCETFDIERVLEHGAHLMGSEGHEYDVEEEANNADMKERLAKQRQQLNARLGLDMAATLGVDLSSMCTNEDLCPVKIEVKPIKNEVVRRPIQELMPLTGKPLSSREMNVAKRKARAAFSKQKSRECEEGPSAPAAPPEPDRKKLKLEGSEDYIFDSGAGAPSRGGGWAGGAEGAGGAARWPLEGWCSALQAQLFSGAWEARHGAASALRELLRARIAASAFASRRDLAPPATEQQLEDWHQEWLEDMALRLLCVLALDRFGDFVSDQVVAPVRETCAQTLGVALARLRAGRVRAVAARVAALARQPQWEARHGALLAFKYLLAARQEVAIESGALEHLMAGLDDAAEDVSAVAAGALAPAAGALAARRAAAVPRLAARLWTLLRDQDDLAAPANCYMALLAALIRLPTAATLLHPIDLVDVLPRLFPYLDHSTSSVRKATLQTLRTLTKPLVTENGHNGTDTGTEKCNDNDTSNDTDNDKGADSGTGAVAASVTMNGDSQYLNWTPELLQATMRHIYQRILFEHVHEIQEIAIEIWENLLRHASLGVILVAACPMLATWMCLAMQPARLPVDPDLLLHTPPKERRPRSTSQTEMDICGGEGGSASGVVGAGAGDGEGEGRPQQKWVVGGSDTQPAALRDANVTRARVLAADVLGYLSCYLVQPAPGIEYKAEDESPIDCYTKVMVVYLRSGSALQRLVAGLVISSWATHTVKHDLFPPGIASHQLDSNKEKDVSKLAPPLLVTTLHTALNQVLYYDEVALNCNRILQEARDLLAMMKHYKLPVDGEEYNNILRLEQVAAMTAATAPLVAGMKAKRVAQTLEQRRAALHAAVAQCSLDQGELNVSVQAAVSGAVACLRVLPDKLNPVIRPLMDSVKREPSEKLQAAAADTLAHLLAALHARESCPNNKVLVNLKAFYRCDPEFTPRISLETGEEKAERSERGPDSGSGDSGSEAKPDTNTGPALDKYNGILTLREQQRSAERAAPRRGRPPALPAPAAPAAPHDALDHLLAHEDQTRKMLRIQRRGATMALTSLTRYFGDELPEKLPKLWEFITQPFEKILTDSELEALEADAGEELISRLQVVEAVSAQLGAGAWRRVAGGARACAALCRAPYTALRHMAARALAALAARDPHRLMDALVQELLEALSEGSACVRCGAAEALARLVDTLQLQLVPYIVLLLVPLLGRMSDHNEAVRVMATRSFATLIQLMPLDGAAGEPAALSAGLRARRLADRAFVDQLFNPKAIRDYRVPVPVAADLRSYQQAGVNWLRFLYEYKLHGVLCDDMGLGKTLQSIVVVASSHFERAQADAPALPSLVVCPPTLTGHWVFEVNKFIQTKYLKPLQYVGPPVERERLRAHVRRYNLIVASYDIVRKDIDFFSSIKWNYCILDEGHVIKNGKTKAFKAIKQLVANHRLILSGTPIQNNVLELWSLFDFLMPGLLGTERQFTARYSRPILAARDPRAAPHHLQAGALACEALHRQVLPFLLRRVKEDVLRELPPKITQDYYCELSPLQRSLYEHFSKRHMSQDVAHSRTHVFQALHYLQNVCNHPKLVLSAEHPEWARVQRQLAAQRSSLDDIHHSAKLPALKQLLLDCGIGVSSSEGGEVSGDTGGEGVGSVVSQHRALIFCQLKSMLDIVERDLLRAHLPSVTYLRLDGSVPAAMRHSIVTRFNTDVSIDLLLLTTSVGGLGLNLTGADTVVFVEHDWNPMRDLQAMDRAHRIGQRRVVNVYRLVTRNTLEEKIMGLQKFKLKTANTVISSENAAMETMGTDQLLDLFQLGAGSEQPASDEKLPELWDDAQYHEEYDMSSFIRSLRDVRDPGEGLVWKE